jgi:hypothetical protein
MGGILLFFALIAVYLLVYWTIHIEEVGDKTKGILGFIPTASSTLHTLKKQKIRFLGKKTFKPQSQMIELTDTIINTPQKSFLKKPKVSSDNIIKKSFLKK